MAEPSTTFSIFGKNKSAKAFRQVKQDMNGVKSLAKGMIGPLAAAFSVVGIKRFASSTLSAADSIGKLSARTGVATDTLQELQHAYELAGVPQEGLNKGLLTFGKRVGKARGGTGALSEGLKKLNPALLDAVNATESQTEALDVIFSAMAGARDEAERLAIADAAFGEAGLKMAAAFEEGAGSFKAARKEAQELGLVLSGESIDNAEAFNDMMTKVGGTVKTQFMQAFLDLAPVILENKDEIVATSKAIGETMVNAIRVAGPVVKGIGTAFQSVGTFIGETAAKVALGLEKFREFATQGKELVDKFVAGFKSAWNAVKEEVGNLIPSWLQDYLKQESPAKRGVLDSEKWGADTAKLFAKGVRDNASDAGDAAEEVGAEMNQITRIAKSAQGTLEDGFTRTFDNIIEGGFKFRDVMSSILNDIASTVFRMMVAQPLAKGITGGITGAFGGGGGLDLVPQFAGGGSPPVGRASLVGERGPELFVPKQAGTIVPNHALGGGGVTIQQNITVDARGSNDPASVEAAANRGIARAAPQIVNAAVEAVRDGRRRNPKFFGGRA